MRDKSLTLEEWKVVLDVINVYDPNDIIHVYPNMGSPEFVQDVSKIFKKVLEIVTTHEDFKAKKHFRLGHTSEENEASECYAKEVAESL